jgi:hypothetical protein
VSAASDISGAVSESVRGQGAQRRRLNNVAATPRRAEETTRLPNPGVDQMDLGAGFPPHPAFRAGAHGRFPDIKRAALALAALVLTAAALLTARAFVGDWRASGQFFALAVARVVWRNCGVIQRPVLLCDVGFPTSVTRPRAVPSARGFSFVGDGGVPERGCHQAAGRFYQGAYPPLVTSARLCRIVACARDHCAPEACRPLYKPIKEVRDFLVSTAHSTRAP